MPTKKNFERFLALHEEVVKKMARVHEIHDAAKDENRDLSRREKGELDKLKVDADRLRREADAANGGPFDPRFAQGETSGRKVESSSDGPGLGPEERMADAARERSNNWGEEGEFRLGACIRAMATGDRSSLSDVERRSLAEGTDSAGGFLIEESLATELIDKIRNKSQVIASGARTLEMPGDTLNVARMTGGSTASWKSENAAVAESDQAYDRVTFKTKTAVVLQKCSVELWEDLSEQATKTIEGEIIAALALKLDLAALRGSGVDPEPKGILNQTGVVIQSMGTNGAQLSGYDDLSTAVGTIAANNGQATGAIVAARTQTFLNKLKDTTGQTVQPPPGVRDLPIRTSNQIPTNIVQGTSGAVTSEAYVADWGQVWIGVRPSIGIRLRLLQDRYMDSLQYGIIAWIRGDVQLAHPEQFVVVTGIKP